MALKNQGLEESTNNFFLTCYTRVLANLYPILHLILIYLFRKSSDDSPTDQSQPLIIGNGNVFEFDSRCESLSVGDDNVFEAKSNLCLMHSSLYCI